MSKPGATTSFLSNSFGVQQIRTSVQNIRASNQNIVTELALFDTERVNLRVTDEYGYFFVKLPSCPLEKLDFPFKKIQFMGERHYEAKWMV